MNFTHNNKNIGQLGEDKIFRKVVSKKKHYMRILEAWGFEETLVQELDKLGCKEVRIKDTDTGNIHSAPFSLFK